MGANPRCIPYAKPRSLRFILPKSSVYMSPTGCRICIQVVRASTGIANQRTNTVPLYKDIEVVGQLQPSSHISIILGHASDNKAASRYVSTPPKKRCIYKEGEQIKPNKQNHLRSVGGLIWARGTKNTIQPHLPKFARQCASSRHQLTRIRLALSILREYLLLGQKGRLLPDPLRVLKSQLILPPPGCYVHANNPKRAAGQAVKVG